MDTLLGALIGGVGFRLRGAGGFARVTGRGATTARILCWAVPMAALCWGLTPLGWEWSAAIAVALWLGCLPPWWGSLDLGRDAHGWARDFVLHSLRGVLWVAPAAAVLAMAGAVSWWLLLPAGLLCGAVYEIGWRLRRPAGARWSDPTEIGEILFGAIVGAALIAASSTVSVADGVDLIAT